MKMTKLKILAVVLVLSLALVGCKTWGVRGNGKLKTVEKSLTNFDKVDVSGAFCVKVAVGENPGLKIRAESNLLKYIKAEVDNGTLEISSSRYLAPRRKFLLKVTTPDLKSLESSGVNKIVVLNINSKRFDVVSSGASEIKLTGKVEKLTAEVSGASSLNSTGLEADYVDVDVSGASSAYVFAKKFLSAEASGASSIKYKGNPEKVETDVSGVSSIAKN